MNFFVATKNNKKLKELCRILLPLGITPISENDLAFEICDVEETGKTFEENAFIKARAGMLATGLATIADDSGLCVDALGGQPGIYSARYAGEPVDNDRNNQKLLNELGNLPIEKRTARFVCSIACVFPDGREFSVSGTCEGYIDFFPRGNKGFGYDVLFVSKLGCFGEISDEQKDSISHRGNALKKLKERLIKEIEEDI